MYLMAKLQKNVENENSFALFCNFVCKYHTNDI
jgi:hypothetical protein